MTETVGRWRELLARRERPRRVCRPAGTPSWRNNAWLAANPWFAHELLAALRRELRNML